MISLSGENVQNTNPIYSYSVNAEKSEPHHINVYKEIVYFTAFLMRMQKEHQEPWGDYKQMTFKNNKVSF